MRCDSCGSRRGKGAFCGSCGDPLPASERGARRRRVWIVAGAVFAAPVLLMAGGVAAVAVIAGGVPQSLEQVESLVGRDREREQTGDGGAPSSVAPEPEPSATEPEPKSAKPVPAPVTTTVTAAPPPPEPVEDAEVSEDLEPSDDIEGMTFEPSHGEMGEELYTSFGSVYVEWNGLDPDQAYAWGITVDIYSELDGVYVDATDFYFTDGNGYTYTPCIGPTRHCGEWSQGWGVTLNRGERFSQFVPMGRHDEGYGEAPLPESGQIRMDSGGYLEAAWDF